jgi:hypothetical protein
MRSALDGDLHRQVESTSSARMATTMVSTAIVFDREMKTITAGGHGGKR